MLYLLRTLEFCLLSSQAALADEAHSDRFGPRRLRNSDVYRVEGGHEYARDVERGVVCVRGEMARSWGSDALGGDLLGVRTREKADGA